ncbi:hypothetical protein Q5P01_024368 [Channa striata]|uniref:Uncharacterized protein n=1 Tax=Channa striata TaxID=64152 RepID=A0AA88IQU1_CHASR|nr:hypothetical protein Q5P01_024368 [Channa striata]
MTFHHELQEQILRVKWQKEQTLLICRLIKTHLGLWVTAFGLDGPGGNKRCEGLQKPLRSLWAALCLLPSGTQPERLHNHGSSHSEVWNNEAFRHISTDRTDGKSRL